MASGDLFQVKCDYCNEVMHEPYIQCCECEVNLCTSCFSSGQEIKEHKNNHKYAIRRNDFPLFDNCNWSAKEECKLLSALTVHGYGNWEEIAKSVGTRSKLECQEHYKKYYLENVLHKELNLLPETLESVFPKPIVPYLYNLDTNRDPPRHNSSDPHLAGYNAHRSEFELSYDHNAESIFNIEDGNLDEDQEYIQALKVALLNAFNSRLRERMRRYAIIQRHGLIMPNKLVAWLQRFDAAFTRQKSEKLLPFMQFMTGLEFDAFMESLNLEAEIFKKIVCLTEYRHNGIKTLHGAKIFKKLKKENDLHMKELKYYSTVMARKFDSQSPIKNRVSFRDGNIRKHKRQSMPLEIMDLPGFSSLSPKEKDLCSNLRLVPQNFLDIKNQLITENNKLGSLRLLDARRIVKIDVNKTRKIYDYLVTEGFITKPI